MITANNANEAWVAVLESIMRHGVRNENTIEVLNNSLAIPMAKCIVDIPERQVSHLFMAKEAAYILSGRNDVSYITEVLPRFVNYSDDGIYQAGAYGPPFIDQLPYIIETLTQHPASRQAVISIWRQRPYASKDIPCTLTLQFLIRDNRMHVIANMRSSDAWIGLIYDMFCFSAIGAVVAKHFGMLMGNLYMNLGSSHIYNKDLVDAATILDKYRDTKFEWAMQLRPTWHKEMIRTLERIAGAGKNSKAHELMERLFE